MGLIPGLAKWVKDPVLLWLWCKLAAIALIQPLAWEFPYAASAALKKKRKKKGKKSGVFTQSKDLMLMLLCDDYASWLLAGDSCAQQDGEAEAQGGGGRTADPAGCAEEGAGAAAEGGAEAGAGREGQGSGR